MIRLGEIDLADPDDRGPSGDGPAWILVHVDGESVGEIRVEDLARAEREPGGLRRMAAEHLAADLRRSLRRPPAPTMDPGGVAVVICTRRRPDLLSVSIEHLLRADPPAGQILVVDNDPIGDETRRVVEAHGVDYVREPRVGLDVARNTGWNCCRGSVVVFVDDDARANPRLVGAYARVFSDPSVGAASGLVLPWEVATEAQREFERLGGMRKGFARREFSLEEVGVRSFLLGVGTNMAFRREALADVDGFDPRLDVGTASRGGGDLDALWRVLEHGWGVRYEPNAVVRHIHRREISGLLAQFSDYGTAYRAFLECVVQRFPERRSEVARELRRWHFHRHLRGPVGAAVRGDGLAVRLLLAERRGSRGGAAAVASPSPAGPSSEAVNA